MSGVTHIHGDAGAVISTPKAEVTINGGCPGIHACPHRTGRAPQSLYDEHEFYRLAGIRAEPREQELLEAFRAKHRLRWRGRGSIERLWRHRRLEYVLSRDDLRINFSRVELVAGWLHFAMGLLLLMAVAWTTLLSKLIPSLGDVVQAAAGIGACALWMWASMEHMVVPEAVALRLMRAEKR